MNYRHYRYIKSLLAFVVVLVTMISAEPVGYVVKLDVQWKLGPVTVYDLSTKKDYLIDNGKCYGPVFSPDGKKVAYPKDNDIFIKNSDGTGEAEALGLNVKTEDGGGTEPCMNWIILDGEEYIYWSEATTEIYRTKLGGPKEKEVVYKNAGLKRLICVSVSKDGKKAGCTVPGWAACKINIETNKTAKYGGCQGSVSPSGTYFVQNVGGHKKSVIRDFETGTSKGEVAAPSGTVNWQRFSHHTDDYFCVSVNKTKAYICEWKTKKYTDAGKGSPLDYYPREIPGFGQLDQVTGSIGTVKAAKQSVQENILHVPAQNMITVNSSQPYRVSIANLSGKELYQYSNSTPCTLPLQQIGLTEGVYVIRLETGNNIINKTISYVKAK